MLMTIDKSAGRGQGIDDDPVPSPQVGGRRHLELVGGLRESRVGLNRRAIDLSAMLHEVASETCVLDAARKVEWAIAPDIKVFADAAHMRRLLQVLLGNAFRFSGDGRSARVEVGFRRREAGRIEIFVNDNGAAFDMQDGDRPFNPMRYPCVGDSIEAEDTRLPGVRRIVEMHDGSIRAESGDGAGATIVFSLPDWSIDALSAMSSLSDRRKTEREVSTHRVRMCGESVAALVEGDGSRGVNQPGSVSGAVSNAARVARLRAEVEQFRFPGRPVLFFLIALAGVAALVYGR